ncbi:hypothetical protein V7O62_08060 [Methanolobus sp. ZRKC2]|uniref:DUF7289 family protein n=1 Tax=Methanolobus sp. ZRKC2 TaxID=3125783 RepID=UPI00324FF952
MTREDRNNAAVSEAVGYIILFAIVTLSMGVIYAVGYPALQSNMDANVFESAEQNFIVLQGNMKKVSFDQAPVKILKVKLQGTSISVGNGSSITISYDNNTIHSSIGDIEFLKDDKAITYEMGSVFKRYPPRGMLMVSKPPMYIDTINNVSITTIGIVSVTGDTGMAGRGIATVMMKHGASEMNMSSGLTDVTLQINSTYAPKWKQYLEETGFEITNSTDSTVSARKNETILTVSKHIVYVEIT